MGIYSFCVILYFLLFILFRGTLPPSTVFCCCLTASPHERLHQHTFILHVRGSGVQTRRPGRSAQGLQPVLRASAVAMVTFEASQGRKPLPSSLLTGHTQFLVVVGLWGSISAACASFLSPSDSSHLAAGIFKARGSHSAEDGWQKVLWSITHAHCPGRALWLQETPGPPPRGEGAAQAHEHPRQRQGTPAGLSTTLPRPLLDPHRFLCHFFLWFGLFLFSHSYLHPFFPDSV